MHVWDAAMDGTVLDQTRRLADLVRRDAPSVGRLELAPDTRFQTRPITLDALTRQVTETLAQGFAGRAADAFPVLYCAWGKCRVGSTALTNLFGIAGLPSYYQPVKAIARHVLTGSAAPLWAVPDAGEEPDIFVKETAGPYSLGEALFNPLEALIVAGYPPEKLHLVVLDREPASAFASWLSKWSERVPDDLLFRNYIVAALNKIRVMNYAERYGIPAAHYVYEASREPVNAVRTLFGRLGLLHRFAESAVTDWSETGALESEQARVIYPVEPPAFALPGLHGSATTYRFHPRKARLTPLQERLLEETGVDEAYRKSAAACLALPEPDQRLSIPSRNDAALSPA